MPPTAFYIPAFAVYIQMTLSGNLDGESNMKLNIKALALAAAILWGAGMFLTGIANMVYPQYGTVFLTVMGTIYPGYQPFTGISSVVIGALYGFVDAGIAAAILAWLYNCFAK